MIHVNQAILLCGGFGTRLKSMFPDVPKALVPVAGKPIIQRQIEWLQSLGVARIHIAAGYKADSIKTWFETTESIHSSVSISVEPEPLGTAGGTKFAISTLAKQSRYLVLNGDSLLPCLSLEDLCSTEHSDYGVTMAVTEISNAARYGTVDVDSKCIARAFREKSGEEIHGLVNAGIYYLSHEVLNLIPEKRACSIEKDVFPILANERNIKCVSFPPPLLDMGTPEGLKAMTDFLIRNDDADIRKHQGI